jgi:hypothetical protein
LPVHADSVIRRLDVTVTKHWNFECGNDGGYFIPAGGARVHLRSGSRVQCQRSGTGILTSQCYLNWIAHILAPAASYLDSHWKVGVTRNSANDVFDQTHILEASRTAVALHHLLDRATEVDVHEFGGEHVCDTCGRLTHGVRIGPEYLNTNGAFFVIEAEFCQRSWNFATNSFRRQKLRYDYVGAKATAKAPEWCLRHPRHRREIQGNFMSQREWKSH